MNTNARETAPQAVGTVGPGGYCPDRRRPDRPARLSSLFVRQQSHDRNIYTVVALQPDRAQRQVRYRPDQPRRHRRHGAGIRELLQPELLPERLLQRRGPRPGQLHQRLRRLHVARQSGAAATRPSTRRSEADQSRDGAGQGPSRPTSTTRSRSSPQFKFVGRRALRRLLVADRQHDQPAEHGRATCCSPMPSRPTPSPACAAARSSSPTQVQTYYVSYSTSFNPSLEQLVTTTGTSQPLPPETNEALRSSAPSTTCWAAISS